jgi:hypothetical protein
MIERVDPDQSPLSLTIPEGFNLRQVWDLAVTETVIMNVGGDVPSPSTMIQYKYGHHSPDSAYSKSILCELSHLLATSRELWTVHRWPVFRRSKNIIAPVLSPLVVLIGVVYT